MYNLNYTKTIKKISEKIGEGEGESIGDRKSPWWSSSGDRASLSIKFVVFLLLST